ncbi:MAG TPA: preprotein translocase subunit SecE [Arenimonas sp.]|jgi:preprotein translocase subunit SecE|nr:preprotein translocase subunit SecE [Arenimonas sp.]HPW33831.1 preprotein translocase subunit SecE [Arenimonas sp.]
MNTKVENVNAATSGADIAKYAVAIALVAGGIFAYTYFTQLHSVLRGLIAFAGVVLGGVVFATTSKGLSLRDFFSEAMFELRKVVWPTRQEAWKVTWVVMVVVVIISLILALFDLVISKLIALLLG